MKNGGILYCRATSVGSVVTATMYSQVAKFFQEEGGRG